MRLIARHWDATGGDIRIGGRNVQDYALDVILENIALISQDIFLFNDTVKANIAVGDPAAGSDEIAAAAKAANAHDFIQSLPDGYETLIGENGARLSGGERQRLSLARALLRRAPVLIMDEATSHLDARHERLIQQAVNQVAGEKTILIVSHRLDSVRHCDHIVMMQAGRVQGTGRHETLLQTCPSYARLWHIQQDNLSWSLGASATSGNPAVEAMS